MTDSAAKHLLDWYGQNARDLPWRNPPSQSLPADPDWPYRVWLSEVMLQQTTVVAVRDYFAAFTARWPTVAALAAAGDGDVMQAWAGLGYYARARNLLACARAVVRDHGGHFPPDEATLRTLPGIGDYTAAAIAAFAFGAHAIVIDGNVERVVTRLHAIDTPLPAARPQIRAALGTLVPGDAAGDFAQGLMDLASRICTPKSPRCLICPLHPGCRAAASGDPTQWPVKAAKRPRPTRHGTAWWIEVAGQVLTVVRPAKGLLGGMRALPSCDWRGDPTPPIAGEWQDRGAVSHGFTHFELVLAVRALHLSAKPALAGDWLNVDDVAAAGLPTLFQKAATLALATRLEAA
ncbi:A/G-specific adenine glycosylase [Sandarakinorhabdus sp. DWP1-3-1]|uniref:A/G-specific adenine glycosylase n=1 Tax=Sandarakinorhabdus sp. DWP1-3-1 TaxID=2804627 RepID=UPI003CF2FB51